MTHIGSTNMDHDTLISELDQLRGYLLDHFDGSDDPTKPVTVEGATFTTCDGLVIQHHKGDFALQYYTDLPPRAVKFEGSIAKMEQWLERVSVTNM